LLDIQALRVEFPGGQRAHARTRVAVAGVDLTLARARTLGLVGESGCGKTMIARAIIGLIPPPGRLTGGRILFEGHDLTQAGDADLRRIRGARIGSVFQEPSTALNPSFSIGHQIADTLAVHGVATGRATWTRAVEWLDRVRMPHAERRAHDYPHQLSGGMRQRAHIAAALACSPALLIADEPTTALDVTVQADILDLLAELRRELGLALLLISHDVGVVADLADRVAVMYAGRIVEEGPRTTVLGAPAHPYTQGLLRSLPGAAPGTRLPTIGGSVPDPTALPPGCAFAPRCPDARPACDAGVPVPVALPDGRAARCVLLEEGR